MCGASSEEKSAYANEQKISGLLTENAEQFAGTDSAILKNITGALEPIEEAGPSQFGLSPQAEAAERTDAAEQLHAAGANASNAVRSAVASQGGGTTYLPNGSSASILGALAEDQAVKSAEAQSGITQHGFDLGREQFEFATEGLKKAPGELENPVTGAGGAAVQGANLVQSGANAITASNTAWESVAGSLIGGVAGGLLKSSGGPKGGIPESVPDDPTAANVLGPIIASGVPAATFPGT